MRERTRCADHGCARTVGVRAHWLCRTHRRERGRAFLAHIGAYGAYGAYGASGRAVTEATVLGELVFLFPARCATVDEFLGRFYAVARCWETKVPFVSVLRQHALLGKVRVVGSMSRTDITEFVSRFASFTVSHARAYGWTRLVQTCADRVADWYPSLVASGPISAILDAERMVKCLPPKARPCLVLADLVRALHPVLSRDAIECVFVRYIGLIRRHELDALTGGFRFTTGYQFY
jgi:hypothetical protein